MKEVTDPATIAQLNGSGAEVTDPAVLAQLNGAPTEHKPGGLESFIRSAANGATFNLADTIAAAGDATIPLDTGSSKAGTWTQRYQDNMAQQRGQTGAGNAEHPIASLTGAIAGGAMNPATRALPVPKTLLSSLGMGAGLGAAYGAGGAVSNQESLGRGAIDTGIGAATGGVLGTLGHGASLLLSNTGKTAAAKALEAEGVNPTIGQMLGGSAQRLEDSHTSIPIYGDAIKDAQRSAVHDFNRASYNRVLEPLGLKYGKDAPVGNQGIEHIGALVSKAYDHAFDGAVVDAASPRFTDMGTKALEEAAHTLPKERFDLVQKNVERLINSKIDQDGALSGDDLIAAKNWFSEQSRGAPNSTQDERAMAAAYKQILGALKSGIMESDPDRAALLKAADSAYSRFARVASAASSNNASGKEGIFTPNQLGTAIRTLETSTRKMGFAKGNAPMQDLAQAGQQTLSQTVPDSGTAIRSIFEHPLAAIATAPAWAAGRALYSKPGQKIAKAVLFGAPNARKAIAPVAPLLLRGAMPLIGSSATQPAP